MEAWSLGYGGHTPDSFRALLGREGVRQVVDVRQNPVSRKRGFGRRQLEAALGAAGVAYVHLPQLGAPKAVRDAYHATGDVRASRRAYATHLNGQRAALRELVRLVGEAPTAFLCVEADAALCHRFVLERRLRRRGVRVRRPEAAPPQTDL